VTSIDDWAYLAAMVDRILDAPVEERAAVVDRLSAGDPDRKAALEGLREECEQEPKLLAVPAASRFAALLEEEPQFPLALRAQYRLTRELGRGGMATVYLAHDVKHARDVAVKVVQPRAAAALGTQQFLAEIEIVAQMHHPHIVPLYDSGEADGALYYVMPYEPGLSLRHRLARDGPLASREVVLFLREVCDALAYAHERAIVHCDIKPDNVLLSGQHALVTDFGIAKATTRAQIAVRSVVAALGTPAYMAPEQIVGDEVDQRTDIYAIGVLGYELLAGQPPFTGDTRQEILTGHLAATPPSLVRLRPEIDGTLAELVMRCLEKEPAKRWESARELEQQLDALSRRDSSVIVRQARRRWRRAGLIAAAVLASAAGVFAWRFGTFGSAESSWRARWARMHIERVTDFPGSEVDAAISANGDALAFLADRDSVFDAFVTRVGSGQFLNLTGGHLDQLFNEDVHNIGFSNDGRHVWLRVAELNAPASVRLMPISGGAARPFLPTAVMVAWSLDGKRLAYHETTPGDPIFVAGPNGEHPRRIYIAPAGLHSHHLTWSPDGRYLYFSHGVPPNEMDIWRISSNGGSPERITAFTSRVAYPAMLDDHTLLYTATDDDGTGPWLYMMNLETRVPIRLSAGVEHFLSIAASVEAPGKPRRLVATVSNPTVQLWSVPIADSIADESKLHELSLPTSRATAPRFAPDATLLYVASRGGTDGVWRVTAKGPAELWKPNDGAVVGAAAASPDGRRICFAVRRHARSTLHCTAADGTAPRIVAESLDVRGAPSWSPDGKWIAIGARAPEGMRVYKVPVEGRSAPVRLVDSVSSNPVWSPDGTFILYSGTARGRSVPVSAVRPDGKRLSLPFGPLVVDRLGDSYRFLPGGKQLVVKLGGFRRQNFWLLELATGARRQLTRLRPGEAVNTFDVSPDGHRIVFERSRENSDVALIELPPS
jgi:serine/threonine protein kinase/Tol biopolymer transport system component